MVKIVGQEKLLESLNKYTAETLPKTIMFLGDLGCGKHLVSAALAERLGLELLVIDESIDHEQLVEYMFSPNPTLYVIDLVKFTEKQQNQFLKFIEEPAKTVYIALLANSEIGILPTILNRCIKFQFEPYTVEQLKQFSWQVSSDNELVYKLCKTPGQLIGLDGNILQSLYTLCDTITRKIDKTSWPNALKIATEINYKENYDKFDFNLFFNTLEYVSSEVYKKEATPLSLKVYNITNAAKKSMVNKTLAKEQFMVNFLLNLWKAATA